MSRSRALEVAELEANRRLHHQGTARVRLRSLDFPQDSFDDLDPVNVARLRSCLRRNCCRLDVHNFIPAIIDERSLRDALEVSRLSRERLLSCPNGDIPELTFPEGFRLQCLHGRHRIEAAKDVLPPGDKWWTVDLYRSGTASGLIESGADRRP